MPKNKEKFLINDDDWTEIKELAENVEQEYISRVQDTKVFSYFLDKTRKKSDAPNEWQQSFIRSATNHYIEKVIKPRLWNIKHIPIKH